MKNGRTIGFLISALILGSAICFGALYVAVGVIGPIARSTLGQPLGYGQDYATRQAWFQATAVRVVTVAVAFLLLGLVLSTFGIRRKWATAFAIANPISASIGYAFYQRLWSGDFAGEYFGYVGMAVIALTAPLVFAPCITLGLRASRRS